MNENTPFMPVVADPPGVPVTSTSAPAMEPLSSRTTPSMSPVCVSAGDGEPILGTRDEGDVGPRDSSHASVPRANPAARTNATCRCRTIATRERSLDTTLKHCIPVSLRSHDGIRRMGATTCKARAVIPHADDAAGAPRRSRVLSSVLGALRCR